jgi:DNA-binding IclR family transcriptional regulator
MSVPVCDATGKLTAVLSSTAPCIQLTRERGDELVPEVMGSATAISGDLRFMHTTDPARSLSRYPS